MTHFATRLVPVKNSPSIYAKTLFLSSVIITLKLSYFVVLFDCLFLLDLLRLYLKTCRSGFAGRLASERGSQRSAARDACASATALCHRTEHSFPATSKSDLRPNVLCEFVCEREREISVSTHLSVDSILVWLKHGTSSRPNKNCSTTEPTGMSARQFCKF